MSTPSFPSHSGGENLERPPTYASVEAQMGALREDSMHQTSPTQHLLPRSTLNRLDIPVIEGIDPFAPTQSPGDMVNATGILPVLPGMGFDPVQDAESPPEYTLEPQNRWDMIGTSRGERMIQTRSNNALSAGALELISADRNAIDTESTQLATDLASQGIDGQDFQRPYLVPFPYNESQQRLTPQQRRQQGQREGRIRQEYQVRQQQQTLQEFQSRRMRNRTDMSFPRSARHRTLLLSRPPERPQVERQQAEAHALTAATADDTIDAALAFLSRQARHSAVTALTGVLSGPSAPAQPSQRFPTLAASPVRYQNLLRVHIQVEIGVSDQRQSQDQGQDQGGLTPQSQPTIAQELSTTNLLPTNQYVLPSLRTHAHIESESAGSQSLVPAPTPPALNPTNTTVPNAIGRAPEPPTSSISGAAPASTSANREASGRVRVQRRITRRLRRESAVPPAPETVREPRAGVDWRFRGLLGMFHSRAALPTGRGRPWHWAAPSVPTWETAEHELWRRPVGTHWHAGAEEVMGWGGLGAEAEAGASWTTTASRWGTNPNPLGSHPNPTQGSISHHHPESPTTSSFQPSNPTSIRHTRTSSPPRITTLPPSRSSHPDQAHPQPLLTRAHLEQYARSQTVNPDHLPWHSLSLLTRVHALRAQAYARAQARLRARRQRAIERLRENERVSRAVLHLALCGALSDSREVLAQAEEGEEDEAWGGRGTRERERERERGWVESGRIVTPVERGALRAALARRDALGERMGVLSALEDVLGVQLGRWAFDVWVAGAAVGALGGGMSPSGSGGVGRIGAVWLGPPGGEPHDADAQSADADSWEGHGRDESAGVREWHVIPEDGDAADGLGEGWVEWRAPGRGVGGRDGRFVVHDVFRFGEAW